MPSAQNGHPLLKEHSPRTLSIRGARQHNLKRIDLDLPLNKLIVFTGLSGSGKSSLAFDTLYAEGQRRYVESLSAYARQFLGRLDKPEVDSISGLSPAVAIEQKVSSRNPRSTVGTATEIYDYLKLLFARVGKIYSPISGREVKRHRIGDVLDYLSASEPDRRLYILAPLAAPTSQIAFLERISLLISQGFARVWFSGAVHQLTDLIEQPEVFPSEWFLVIDRATAGLSDEDDRNRMADSVQTAFYEGRGKMLIQWADTGETAEYSDRLEADGMEFVDAHPNLFSFNNPMGACPRCEGFGSVIGIDPDLVIPDPTRSVYEDAVVAWKGEKMQEWKLDFIADAHKHDFPVHKPYAELNEAEVQLLWKGKGRTKGIEQFFEFVEKNSYKIQYRVMLARYRGKTTCPDCGGSRMRKEASYVRIAGQNLTELVQWPVSEVMAFFDSWKPDANEEAIGGRLLNEIRNRLAYLERVGLGYLSLSRVSSSLSGGESQRIHLATALGSSLVGSMYILDEPSIGLHPADTRRLIEVLKSLRDLGNTVIVVEHDEEIMRSADWIVDIGPEAGVGGGHVLYSGPPSGLIAESNGYTARYLAGLETLILPGSPRQPKGLIRLFGARENNLKSVDIDLPLGLLTVVSGVSGSGKSSLIRKILYPALRRELTGQGDKPGRYSRLEGDLDMISSVEFIDQNPIGRSSRSNPVTYVKAFDEIRGLFAELPISKQRGYKSKHFSFNVVGGRCETCQGEGSVTVEMQFMADLHLVCETCNGKKFKDEVLEVRFGGLNISEILDLTVDEALEFFVKNEQKAIVRGIAPLAEVGLGYVRLGQSSSTLSGGEAQRIKLASFLLRGQNEGKSLFLFDEPTTGLHFHDIGKLLKAFAALLDRGHSIVVIEHHPDLIRQADWIIDLGPGGGSEGGRLVYQGGLKGLLASTDSVTAQYL